MSHRSFRSTLVPLASGLAAVIAVSWPGPALAAAGSQVAGSTVQAREWWLGGLHVTQAWKTTDGAGVTVAVLGTGVVATHPDLAGSVTTGPDFSHSGRTPGGAFWGVNGTGVAAVIAGHGHGPGREAGILGIAPAARILSIRVTLEYNDPLNSDPAITRRLPAAIADGITYAVDHGARVIDLPLDPGTAGLTGQGDPAAAGGSAAERQAVAYALSKDVVLVAPAGDDGQGAGRINYPAAYPGVIAVGAVGRDGQVAPFSSRHSYVSVTAPGVGLVAAAPPGAYTTVSSTSEASGIVAGLAALVLSRFPQLTGAQVSQVLTGGVSTASTAAPGAGRGTVDAARALGLAAALVSASPPSQPSRASTASMASRAGPAAARSHKPVASAATAASLAGASASAVARSLVRYIVAGLFALIALLAALLMVIRRRREKAAPTAADAGRGRGRGGRGGRAAPGQHEQRKAGRRKAGQPGSRRPGAPGPFRPAGPAVPAGPAGPAVPAGSAGSASLAGPGIGRADGSAAAGRPQTAGPAPSWTATGGWQGGGLGQMAPSPDEPSRPAVAPPPRAGRAARAPGSAGPPWEPAPAPLPERTFGSLPVVASSALPPDPGPGIRVPGDMAAMPALTPDAPMPVSFDLAASPDPDFPPRPAVSDDTDPAIPGIPSFPVGSGLTRHSLGFAAAPVPLDYAPPRAPDFTVPSRAAGLVLSAGPDAGGNTDGPAAPAADPSYIWDLAATDVFPPARPGRPPEPPEPPEAEMTGEAG